MSKIRERLMATVERAEAEGKGNSLAEIERLVIRYGEEIQARLMSGLVEERQGGNKPKKNARSVSGS
jgi:hypothetical protein